MTKRLTTNDDQSDISTIDPDCPRCSNPLEYKGRYCSDCGRDTTPEWDVMVTMTHMEFERLTVRADTQEEAEALAIQMAKKSNWENRSRGYDFESESCEQIERR